MKKRFLKNNRFYKEFQLLKNKLKIEKVVDEMITIYLDNLRTTKTKGGKGKKPRVAKVKPLKLPGLLGVSKKDPRDLLGEVKFSS